MAEKRTFMEGLNWLQIYHFQTRPDVSYSWQRCLDKNQILWEPTEECFNPLEQGPCNSDQWLVLKDDLENSNMESACVKKLCDG